MRLTLRSFRLNWSSGLLIVLLALAFGLRAYGLDWDRGLYFHPDERQILMVVERLALPKDWRTLLSPESPLNPRFFAYGSLPIYLLRLVSWLLSLWDASWASLRRFYLLGRVLSAVLDAGIVLAAYFVACRAFRDRRVAILTSSLLTFAVLHIQLAHFYTVDTLLTLLVLLALDKAMRVALHGRRRDGVWLGVWLGAALATKLSVLPLAGVAVLAWLAFGWSATAEATTERRENAERTDATTEYTENAERTETTTERTENADRTDATTERTENADRTDTTIEYTESAEKVQASSDCVEHAEQAQVGVPSSLPSLWPPRSRWWTLLLAAWRRTKRGALGSLGLAALTFLALQPYALIDALRFGQGVGTELAMSQGWADFPYTRQYLGTPRFLYQVRQMLLFTLGPGLTLVGLAGLLYVAWRFWKRPDRRQAVWLAWALPYALLQGLAFVKFVRYILPLSPFLCMAAAALLCQAWDVAGALAGRARRCVARVSVGLIGGLLLLSTVCYGLAFVRIYAQPHPWLQATDWICAHAPPGSTFSADFWDDPLPLDSTSGDDCPADYSHLVLDLHAPDTTEKREGLLDVLQACDYIVLSSDRLYAPLSRFPQRYPLASAYYRQLFAGRLGFQLVAAPAVYPNLVGVTLLDDPRAGLGLATPPLLAQRRLPGLVLNLGRADESFTVYDHPQPLIFARVERLSREELARLLAGD